MSALDDINTLEQTAEYLKVQPATLRRIVAQKRIGSLKQGRALTFPRAAVEAYVEAYSESAAAPNPFGLTDSSLRRIAGRQT